MTKTGLVLILLMLACGTSTLADTIGTLTLTNCGSTGTGCPGATYHFDINSTSATLTITVNSPLGTNNDLITGLYILSAPGVRDQVYPLRGSPCINDLLP